jgi:hypothetical protein
VLALGVREAVNGTTGSATPYIPAGGLIPRPRLPGSAPAVAAGPAESLTDRELEVLGLQARGHGLWCCVDAVLTARRIGANVCTGSLAMNLAMIR